MIDDLARQYGPSGGHGSPTDVSVQCQLDGTTSVFIKPELGSVALSLPRKRQRAGPIVPPPPRSAGEWVASRVPLGHGRDGRRNGRAFHCALRSEQVSRPDTQALDLRDGH